MNTIKIQTFLSPVGEMILGDFDNKLCLCDWMCERRREVIDNRIKKSLNADYEYVMTDTIAQAITELNEYFARERTVFDIPLLFIGTDFQKKVWNRLLEIPYGTTISYGEMAQQMGCRQSVRAVANANGANSVSIFVPCHRVIGSNRKLVGYAGGLQAKKGLLEVEGLYI